MVSKVDWSWWLPRLLKKRKDGGPDSPVTAYFLLEWKPVCSIGLLHFPEGSRENYHSHAFESWSILLWGQLRELVKHYMGSWDVWHRAPTYIRTHRETFHRVKGIAASSWALTFRGPWVRHWQEYNEAQAETINLAPGRVIISTTKDNP